MYALKIIKWILISIGAVFLVLLSLLIFAYWYMSSGVFSSDSFDKTKWHAAVTDASDATCYRGGMAKDIQNNLLSKAITESDVIILLGKPSGHFTKQEDQYSLGMCSGLGIDYDHLHIYFDKQGYFSEAKIIRH